MKFRNYNKIVGLTLAAVIIEGAAISFNAPEHTATVDGFDFKAFKLPVVGDYIAMIDPTDIYHIDAEAFAKRYQPKPADDVVTVLTLPEPELTPPTPNFSVDYQEQNGGEFGLMRSDLESSLRGMFNQPIEVPERDVEALGYIHADLIENALVASGHDVRVTPMFTATEVEYVIARQNGFASVLMDIFEGEGGALFIGANPEFESKA